MALNRGTPMYYLIIREITLGIESIIASALIGPPFDAASAARA
jgi:hypothetical protein